MGNGDLMSDVKDSVVVYRYDYWDEDQHRMVTSTLEATLQCIKDGLGIPVIESGRKVPRAAVDSRGRLIVTDQQQQRVSPKDR
jgi:hypothetical protein